MHWKIKGLFIIYLFPVFVKNWLLLLLLLIFSININLLEVVFIDKLGVGFFAKKVEIDKALGFNKEVFTIAFFGYTNNTFFLFYFYYFFKAFFINKQYSSFSTKVASFYLYVLIKKALRCLEFNILTNNKNTTSKFFAYIYFIQSQLVI